MAAHFLASFLPGPSPFTCCLAMADQPLLASLLAKVSELLQEFARRSHFLDDLTFVFGDQQGSPTARSLQQLWLDQDTSHFPAIEVISDAALKGASAAYATETNTIYLAEGEFQAGLQTGADEEALVSLVLHEYGHYVDSQLNDKDSEGDEGALFADVAPCSSCRAQPHRSSPSR